jgi:uracil phosphoribosyltransferase
MAYEISKILERKPTEISTPLGTDTSLCLVSQPVLATVLRAGLPMHQGFLNYFDKADNAFVSAFREHTDAHSFEIKVGYLASPDLNGRTLILIDPMLATGRSMYQSYLALLKRGKPGRVIIASLIGSEQGLDYIKTNIPEADIYIAVVDPLLNEDSYIVPGLGDAGDLCFGEKL